MYRQKLKKRASFIICCIFVLNLALNSMPVYAMGETVVLNGPNESANKLFTADNMFPGDEISQDYILNISHKKNIDIMFSAKIHQGYEILSEVLKMKVMIVGIDAPLYDGLLKDMPDSLTYTLPKSEKSLTYRLLVYLETTVGNKSETDPDGKRYQNQELKADFSWWYMPESSGGGGGGGSQGGGSQGGGSEGGGSQGGVSEGGGSQGGGSQGGGSEGGGSQGGGAEGGGSEGEESQGGGAEGSGSEGEGAESSGIGIGADKPVPGTTKMLRRAYVIGRPGSYFRPEASITRAETATIFARIFADYDEDNLASTDTKFNDVKTADWFAKYISRLEDENIIFGYNDNFRPEENITRAEFAAICVRFFEKRSKSTIKPKNISFTDFESSHWAYETIKKAYANGYITGYPDGTLGADSTITRAEAVTVVNRMLERIPDKEYIDNNLHKLVDFLDVRDKSYWAYYEIFEAANTHFFQFENNFANWVD